MQKLELVGGLRGGAVELGTCVDNIVIAGADWPKGIPQSMPETAEVLALSMDNAGAVLSEAGVRSTVGRQLLEG